MYIHTHTHVYIYIYIGTGGLQKYSVEESCVFLNGFWLLCPCPAPPHVAMNSMQLTPHTKQSHLRMLHGCLRPTLVQCGTRSWAKHMATMCLAKSKV